MSYEFLGKHLSGRFTISLRHCHHCTPASFSASCTICLQLASLRPKVSAWKPERAIASRFTASLRRGCFVNAVGLTNPGARASLEALRQVHVPDDRFLLVSIFGGSTEEFVEVARLLEPVADGFELNLSCPHAAGYGMAMGQDPDMVYEIVSAVKQAVALPVIPKLTPNVANIAVIGEAALRAGADRALRHQHCGPRLHRKSRAPRCCPTAWAACREKVSCLRR